ncbi:MAG TPA: hypothetical protein DGF10_02310 [Acidimicrobiaceae bacterium]|nr:hypothetical protein [Acidimicrobiaceae bacterium]HAQ22646.1 hypothetical protein [Acidimicrobiaceae bacterium]HCV33476.1 hypothetical protein [Acidimicrobiaceae bacterium]
MVHRLEFIRHHADWGEVVVMRRGDARMAALTWACAKLTRRQRWPGTIEFLTHLDVLRAANT